MNRLNTFGENLRRARLPFVFKSQDLTANVTPDFGGSPDGDPTLYEANINYTPTKPLTLTGGYFEPWLTLQDSTSSNDFLFLEREAVARYSHIDLNDRVARGRSAASTGGVFGGVQDIYAVGVNWYPNDHLRLMLDYDIVNVDRLNAAGTTQVGQRVQAVALRAQAAF